jgi:hypothetical protein
VEVFVPPEVFDGFVVTSVLVYRPVTSERSGSKQRLAIRYFHGAPHDLDVVVCSPGFRRTAENVGATPSAAGRSKTTAHWELSAAVAFELGVPL